MQHTLSIFVFFDKRGVFSKSSEYLLSELSKFSTRLIVVINGDIDTVGLNRIKSYTKEIYQRANIGYDGGAYKDVFTKYLSASDLKQFDEILLCNDTFYGPFYPFEEIFSKMRKEKCDFWGLTKYLGEILNCGKNVKDHVQGYFIVCNKRLFLSEEFMRFWTNLNYPATYIDAVLDFEIGFSTYFIDKGYCNKAFSEVCGWKIKVNCNNYIKYCGTLISDYNFPVLKKRSIFYADFDEVYKALTAIEGKNLYPIDYIREQLDDLGSCFLVFSPKEILKFISGHDKIWIYGAGSIGNRVKNYLLLKKVSFAGVVVSKKENSTEDDIIEFSKIKIGPRDGLILALGESLSEVLPSVEGKIPSSQLLIPCYEG